jgi:hypothetical protein
MANTAKAGKRFGDNAGDEQAASERVVRAGSAAQDSGEAVKDSRPATARTAAKADPESLRLWGRCGYIPASRVDHSTP